MMLELELQDIHRVPVFWSGLKLHVFLHFACLQCHIPPGATQSEGPGSHVVYS